MESRQHHFINFPSLKKKFFTSLSASPGKNLFIKIVLLQVKVSTSVRFLCSIAFKIWSAHSSAVIRELSSRGVSPCASPFLFKAAFLMLEAVKPGQTHI